MDVQQRAMRAQITPSRRYARRRGTASGSPARRRSPCWRSSCGRGPSSALFLASWPLLLAQPRGDGHPVLVLPPFGANDADTSPLRACCACSGTPATAGSLGQNLGPTAAILDGVPEAAAASWHERTGRKVSVIGWSAGGILGREAARRHPDAVRQVITLGSPFRLLLDDRYKTHAALLLQAHRAVAHRRRPTACSAPSTASRCSRFRHRRSTAAPTASRAGSRASRTTVRARRTSRCTAATAGSGTTRRRSSPSPTGSRSPRVSGRRSRRRAALHHLFPRPPSLDARGVVARPVRDGRRRARRRRTRRCARCGDRRARRASSRRRRT